VKNYLNRFKSGKQKILCGERGNSGSFRSTEFIESLNKNNVQYLVIGGYAIAFHGHPRYTKDIDF
jgi:hypothetical protein